MDLPQPMGMTQGAQAQRGVKGSPRRAHRFVLAWLKEMLLLDGMLLFRGAMILLSGIIEGTD
uniref:Uncharacterized protein n=1 Tax=Oryza rufipogon TaxID=4529 RepID=A0A0E0RI17_ORYRU